MNWTMGRYIDGLDSGGRDKLISAPEFNDGDDWGGFDDECGCLVGTVGLTGEEMDRHYDALPMAQCGTQYNVPWYRAPASIRYPQAVRRFGKARVVRAIKLRAARLNGCDPETIRAILEAPAHV